MCCDHCGSPCVGEFCNRQCEDAYFDRCQDWYLDENLAQDMEVLNMIAAVDRSLGFED